MLTCRTTGSFTRPDLARAGTGRNTGVGDYGVDENGEGSVGKVPSCYLTGEAQRNTTDILLSRKLTIAHPPESPSSDWLWSLPILQHSLLRQCHQP